MLSSPDKAHLGRSVLLPALLLAAAALPACDSPPPSGTPRPSAEPSAQPIASLGLDSEAPPRRGMIYIPGGALVAGSPPHSFPRIADEEMPGLQVIFKGFYIDAFAHPNEEGAIPLTNVSQEEAQTLCEQRGKRLCSELEWERACKGPDNKSYEYGDVYRAETCGTGGRPMLAPSGLRVGCKSDFGVHDLHGGVWEWTASPWGRGTDGDLVTLRGGNGLQGPLIGRCANGKPMNPTKKSGTTGFRCCAGERNTAEVVLDVVGRKGLESKDRLDHALMQRLVDVMPSEADADLGKGSKFVPDRMWSWHPIGNDELVVVGGCVRSVQPLRCGVIVGRQSFDSMSSLAWVSSGHWFPSLHPEKDPSDLWLLGGDEIGRYKRLVKYNWGEISVGPKERRLPKLVKRKSEKKRKR
ncbi:MAG TPA: SUMF1/EgtB/PvdO family nonheme iron enzyme [Polyangiaceae bacterium]|nr:SUMF1/EgtB/PvdO family nonheme iron enzyme [Polyangiaceae bacterium]